jgi:hypothetical protein
MGGNKENTTRSFEEQCTAETSQTCPQGYFVYGIREPRFLGEKDGEIG